VSRSDAWFTYYYWVDDGRAPDFARTVDIHRKPGYDPVELFLDPVKPWIKGRMMWRLLQKRLGLRCLMDVIPLDAGLVRGSHGAIPADLLDHPVLVQGKGDELSADTLESTDICRVISQAVQRSD
jgi:hypothetical protein